jgi:hypothetical protein
MKQIEHEALITLMKAIYYQPCADIVHFSQNDLALCTALASYCADNDFGYCLYTPLSSFWENAKRSLSSFSSAKAFKMPLERPRFLIGGKTFDYLVVTMPLKPSQRLAFLQKAHAILRNHGKIVLFLPKDDVPSQQACIQDLETAYFVATSIIEGMFEHYEVILSNKMHGWM